MRYRALVLAALLALATGCGDSTPPGAAQLARAGRYDEAIQVSTAAIRANPQDAEAYLNRARAHHWRKQRGDLERAVEDYSESIRIAPKDPEAYYSRAVAYRDLGDSEKSAADEKTARELDTQRKEIYASLPNVTPESAIPKGADEVASDAAGADNAEEVTDSAAAQEKPIKSWSDERQEFDRLKRRFEPENADPTAPDAAAKDRIAPLLRRPPYKVSPPESVRPVTPPAMPTEERGLAQPRGRSRYGTAPSAPSVFDLEPIESPFGPRDPLASVPSSPRRPQSPFQTQRQTPFPQRAPRATGFVADPDLNPFRQQPAYEPPPPTIRPFGAVRDDYNP